DRLGLTLEALPDLFALGEMLGQHLDRNGSIEPRVPRLVDFPHSSGPKRGKDLVRAEMHAGGQGHFANSPLIRLREMAEPREPRRLKRRVSDMDAHFAA